MPRRKQPLPANVQATLDSLNSGRKKKLVVGMVGGRYYVFDTTAAYSEEEGKKKTLTLYMGKIKNDGTFVPARHRKEYTQVREVAALAENLRKSPAERIIHPDKIDSKILEMLSTDGRVPVSEIAKETGLSVAAVKYRISKLERLYGIKYTLEFGPMPFNFFRFIAFVKFRNGMPDPKEMKKVIGNEPGIQFAALIKGKYDLFMYMIAEDTQLLENSIYRMRTNSLFFRYKALWNVSYISYAYGYIPLRNEFIELLKDKIWHRTKETPRRKPDQILERDYLVLKELNENGRANFSDIDRKLNLKLGASDYTYYKLVHDKVIYRVTINMLLPHISYSAILRCPQENISSFDTHRNEYRSHIIRDINTPTDRYILVGDIGAPYGSLFIKPIYDEDLNSAITELKHYIREERVDSYIITDTLIGALGYRKIAKEVTSQYKRLTEQKEEQN